MTLQELRERQSWTLEQKIDHSLGTIEAFVNGWVARNKDNSLYIFKAEPWYNSPRGYWDDRLTSIGCFSLSPELFPQITFDNSPMEVTITIKLKKKQ